MNLYTAMASTSGTADSTELAVRLATWHDAMVEHERRLRTRGNGGMCDDECPHAEARALWAEALATFGERAHELSFLRSRAMKVASPMTHGGLERAISMERGRF